MSTGPSQPGGFERLRHAPSRHTFAIGIDPGVNTGFAVFHRWEKSLKEIRTMSFWECYLHILKTYAPDDCELFVEWTKHLGIYARYEGQVKKGKGDEIRKMMSIVRKVGSVIRETELLVAGLEAAGYKVIKAGVADKDTWNDKFFKMITKHPKTVSQHARDACCLCWMR